MQESYLWYMNRILAYLLFLIFPLTVEAQPLPTDLLTAYKSAKSPNDKGKMISDYLGSLRRNDSTTGKIALSLLSYFKEQNDESGACYTNVGISYVLTAKGDFAGALKICFDALPYFEQVNDSFGIMTTNRALSNAYFAAKEYETSAYYDKKALNYFRDNSPENKATISKYYNGIGCIYGEGGMPDSGMVYAQRAVNLDTELKNYQQLALSISTLAENYIAAGEFDIALPFLRKSLNYYETKQAKINAYLNAYLMNDFSQVFLGIHQPDSSIHYAHKALAISVPAGLNEQNMRSYEYLYKNYEVLGKQDSMNIYFRLAMTTKDSLFTLQKAKSVEALGFKEQLRQQDLKTAALKAEEERNENMQYALIALSIVTFIIGFLILSRTIITNTKIIEYFGIMALLIVFEFMNLLLHPFIEKVTHHTPVLMLLSLVCIAAILIPIHHKLEKWTIEKLVEKNKALRLAQAQKTIETLSRESTNSSTGRR